MSLEDNYQEEPEPQDDAGPLWRAEWTGDEGQIQTGAVPDDFNPNDFSAVLTQLGYAPDEIRMELVAATRWEQRSARRDESGRTTGEYERAWLNAYRYRATRNGLVANLPALYAEVKATTPSGVTPTPSGSTAVVCWADIQTGKVDHLGGVKELLVRLDAKREALQEYLTQAQVDRVIVADVGDIIEGFENTRQQTYTNGLSLMDQIDVAATELWKTIRLCEGFGHVDVLSVPSNHCQWRRRKDLIGKPNDDWGLHISQRLERHNDEAGLAVAFHRPQEWSETLTFDVRGTKLGMAHGHQASNPDQIKNWWAKMTHAGVLDCQVLLTGHFHFPSLRPVGKDHATQRSRWHIQASTIDNGSAWVRNKYGEDGDPALTVFQINEANGFDVRSFALL